MPMNDYTVPKRLFRQQTGLSPRQFGRLPVDR